MNLLLDDKEALLLERLLGQAAFGINSEQEMHVYLTIKAKLQKGAKA